MSNSEFAILTGTTFTLMNTISMLFMGYLTDNYNRKWLFIFFAVVWSGATFIESYAHSFIHLLFPRLIQEIALAANFPLSFSLIADYFSEEYKARANAVYSLGMYLGVGLSSLSLVMVMNLTWMKTFRILAYISLACGLLLLIAKEPKRGQYNT